MKRSSIGGQAVMEGVMMMAPGGIAVAVRAPSGEIVTKYEDFTPPSKKHKILGWPIIRGVVNFVNSLRIGMKTMTYSAEVAGFEEEPTKFEKWLSAKLGKGIDQIVIGVAVVLAVVMAVGLFILAPQFIASLIGRGIASPVVKNLIEGAMRLAIFLLYIVAVSAMKDIRRVFMYHGAEHKVIATYEADEPLTVENARKHTRLHPRCGTNYLFLVMAISILFFSLFGWNMSGLARVGIRLAFLPVVAGISYEVLKLAAASDGVLARIVRFPGLMLQHLTTREPTDDMLEVAITAFELASDPEGYRAKQAEPTEPAEAAGDTDEPQDSAAGVAAVTSVAATVTTVNGAQ